MSINSSVSPGDLRPPCARGTAGREAGGGPGCSSSRKNARRGVRGRLSPTRVEDRSEGRQPFVDVPAHQELIGRAALELDQLELIGVDRCLLVGSRRLDAATDVGQRITQPRADPPRRGGVAGAQLEARGDRA